MSALLLGALRRLARVFYRRVEAAGVENVPLDGPVLFVANHVNGLLDPLVVLAVVERPIVFVAKSTLWRIPVLGRVLESLGTIPVVRRSDVAAGAEEPGADRNEASLRSLAHALDEGRAVLIFPEGRSHNDPSLSPIRTGAARVVLLARGAVPVVPAGIFFTRKEEFRSDVLVRFGPPVVPAAPSGVEEWTAAIEEGLRAATLNAESWADHEAAQAVEAIYGTRLLGIAGAPAAAESDLERSFRSRRLLLDARRVLAEKEPHAIEELARRARVYRRACLRAGVGDAEIPERVASTLVKPFAILGILAFFVPYRLVGVAARRLGRPDLRDQVALDKILAGLVLYPLAYALEVAAAALAFGAAGGVTAALVLPVAAVAALGALDEGERESALARRRFLLATGRASLLQRLAAERDALRAECDRLAAVYGAETGR